jgi:hypothetical protein
LKAAFCNEFGRKIGLLHYEALRFSLVVGTKEKQYPALE